LSDLTGLTTNPLLKEGGGALSRIPQEWREGGGEGDKIRIGIFDSSKGIVNRLIKYIDRVCTPILDAN
jgi:hypothetical protein